jgi:hypothetical protein
MKSLHFFENHPVVVFLKNYILGIALTVKKLSSKNWSNLSGV